MTQEKYINRDLFYIRIWGISAINADNICRRRDTIGASATLERNSLFELIFREREPCIILQEAVFAAAEIVSSLALCVVHKFASFCLYVYLFLG